MAIHACERSKHWQKALDLLQMSRRLISAPPSVISYCATINACSVADKWQQAVCLLQNTLKQSLSPDDVAFTSTIKACQRSEQWEFAELVERLSCQKKTLKASCTEFSGVHEVSQSSACSKAYSRLRSSTVEKDQSARVQQPSMKASQEILNNQAKAEGQRHERCSSTGHQNITSTSLHMPAHPSEEDLNLSNGWEVKPAVGVVEKHSQSQLSNGLEAKLGVGTVEKHPQSHVSNGLEAKPAVGIVDNHAQSQESNGLEPKLTVGQAEKHPQSQVSNGLKAKPTVEMVEPHPQSQVSNGLEAKAAMTMAEKHPQPQSTSTATETPEIGWVVELRGLKSRPELNGLSGQLESGPKNGRWNVKLSKTEEIISVKESNFKHKEQDAGGDVLLSEDLLKAPNYKIKSDFTVFWGGLELMPSIVFAQATPAAIIAEYNVASLEEVHGPWILHASAVDMSFVLVGTLVFSAEGGVVYVADGDHVIGRGVGQWMQYESALAFEVAVFQYPAASTVVTEGHQIFRGVASQIDGGTLGGSIWLVPAKSCDSPTSVGCFQCLRPGTSGQGELLRAKLAHTVGQSSAGAMMQFMEAVEVALSAVSLRSRFIKPDWSANKYGSIPEIYYIRNWIEPEEEAGFMVWSDTHRWDHMTERSSHEHGLGDKCECGRSLARTHLPKWITKLTDQLHDLGCFDKALYPINTVRINSYQRGQGIHPHVDGAVYYPKVAIISLGCPCVFSFYPRTGNEQRTSAEWDKDKNVPGGKYYKNINDPICSFLLERRSLIVFSREAFWHNRHGIVPAEQHEGFLSRCCNTSGPNAATEADGLGKGRRISLTIRHLLPRCGCQVF
eukprot:gnl/MRDRNA2_/MRDRNA2_151195_c0_seq1.p1 gnl/MRDRNA2_/MRDRNA2_151195_c0~~gnl/MRDRNA2_/MRDRNA2_151195_c0_seq1.p1  ORF type:complete len:876 (+),score=142.28 gnl/MRDRNA2_/MRDRNA2_151195_c0_seq1:113-2629(+)